MFLFAFRLRAIVPASTCAANVAKYECVCVCVGAIVILMVTVSESYTVLCHGRLEQEALSTSDQIVKVGQQ